MTDGQGGDAADPGCEQTVGADEQCADQPLDDHRKGSFDFDVVAGRQDLQPEPGCPGRGVCIPHDTFLGRVGRIRKQTNDLCLRNQFRDEFQTLRRQIDREKSNAGKIAVRPRHAAHQTVPYRIAADHEHDRDRRGRSAGCAQRWRSGSKDYIDVTTDQIGGECLHLIVFAASPAIFDGEVLTLCKSKFAETLPEGREARRKSARRSRGKVTDDGRFRLRSRAERHRRDAAKCRNKVAPSHYLIKASRLIVEAPSTSRTV